MADWKKYFAGENWVTLDEAKNEFEALVVGWGVSGDESNPQPYLVVQKASGTRAKVRVNRTSFFELDKYWGSDPENYVGKVVLITVTRIKVSIP
ncbi:MAG: hypothetical protein RMI91_15275 [Gemmatales bacterium]|nr:hypothetical protein [Gemmatales bacterium]